MRRQVQHSFFWKWSKLHQLSSSLAPLQTICCRCYCYKYDDDYCCFYHCCCYCCGYGNGYGHRRHRRHDTTTATSTAAAATAASAAATRTAPVASTISRAGASVLRAFHRQGRRETPRRCTMTKVLRVLMSYCYRERWTCAACSDCLVTSNARISFTTRAAHGTNNRAAFVLGCCSRFPIDRAMWTA